MFAGLPKTRLHSKRHYLIVMAFAIVLIGLTLIIGSNILSPFTNPVIEPVLTLEQSETVASNYDRSAPVRLVIPTLNLDTTFVEPLGLMPDKTVSVPNSYTKVGWYSGGVSPGEIGSSVILGHVDSAAGPAVFYSLGQLKVGDEIDITRDDGAIIKYSVTKLERHSQDNFPILAVYGPTKEAELRLVTCTGIYNKGEKRYSHNLVVFGKIIE